MNIMNIMDIVEKLDAVLTLIFGLLLIYKARTGK